MKKLFFTLALALGALSVSAQEAGSMWVGGSVGLSSSKTKVNGNSGDTETSYKILPEFGYVLSDNLAVGINVGYSHTEGYLEALDVTGKVNGFVIAPFLRYTFLKGDLGGLFVDAGVGYSHAKEKNTKFKIDGLEVGLRPGVAFNISERVVLTGKFGFLGYQQEEKKLKSIDYKDKVSTFALDLNLSSLLIGASLKF